MISRIDIEDMTDAQDEARAIAEAAQITMTYRNWRGEVAQRTIRPVALWFGRTDWHPEPGWLLNAWDCDKGERRDFALADCQFAALARPSQAGDERVLEAAESNADRVLWCVHVLGPDDVFAVKSHADAVSLADQMNRDVFAHFGDTDILCFAYAAPWPHDHESHAAALAQMESNDG